MVSAVRKLQNSISDSNSTESTETKKPNIIAIMNESFADLKEVGDLQVSQVTCHFSVN